VFVQEGIYVFEYHFQDWPSNESYHISYQRCCRNESITNIVTPGDVGATFTVELTPLSQSLCNNSPVYNTFPPIVICVNEPLVYDHSAVDPEGDQLVYELCSPLLGGGLAGNGGGNPNGCNGITPNPACPLPYDPVEYVNPPYSPLNPMGGSPQVTIDPVTGMLTGTPTVQGQFSVAVCIYEYRNGQLLSVIRRDFQFNVANCQPVIDANVGGENINGTGDSYFVQTCGDPTISLTNLSTNTNNIDSWRWEFYAGDSTYVFNSWDATVTFPESGIYEGALLLNPESDCGDTASISIEIYPELVPAFDYSYDTCVAGPVSFNNLSFIDGPGSIDSFRWDLGDGTIDTAFTNPVHIYDEPGVVAVNLEIWDEHGCFKDTSRAVVYKPVPAVILVKPNDTVSCAPAELFFNNLSAPIGPTYDIHWDFGDGDTSAVISPTHVYRQEGLYDVKLDITSPIGCHTDTLYKELIQILSPPVAGFYFDPTDPDNFHPEVSFFDQSTDAVHWDWYINGQLASQNQDFDYSFPDTGLQEVKLVITHPQKCLDSLVQYIDVKPKVTFFLPNAFTPNEDTVNDFFAGTGVTRGITNFRLEIWDRWGERIFETDSPAEAWNGRVNNTGRQAPSGVYVCLVSYTRPRGETFEYKGFATLIR
jgi:gliding motility-associated-like protein